MYKIIQLDFWGRSRIKKSDSDYYWSKESDSAEKPTTPQPWAKIFYPWSPVSLAHDFRYRKTGNETFFHVWKVCSI